jgi:hypothetical protein
MPGRWSRGSRPRVSWPTARPAERTDKSSRASNLKSQPVAFGISRPTRTPTEESTPDSEVERPPTAGWTETFSRPGTAAGSQLPQDPTYACRHSTVPEARNTADSAGEQQPGRRGNPRPGRWPGSHLRVSWPTARPAGRERYWDNLAGREVEPATHCPQSA